MFGVMDYGAFVVAVIVFLAIPGPGNLALVTSTGKGGLAGGLAATQTVINILRQRAAAGPPHIWSVGSMFDVANLVADAMRDLERPRWA